MLSDAEMREYEYDDLIGGTVFMRPVGYSEQFYVSQYDGDKAWRDLFAKYPGAQAAAESIEMECADAH
jgi:hypothetical protein